MATTYSRHSSHYATPTKTLPITMPSKTPAFPRPMSRVNISPPEYSDYSSSSSRHSGGSYSVRSSSSYSPSESSAGEYERTRRHEPRDIDEMLSDRMDQVFSPLRMDRGMARQAQDSGNLNAKERELRELQDRARARLKTARVNFAQGLEDAREVRRDLDYCANRTDSMKSRGERHYPEACAKSKSRSRHAA